VEELSLAEAREVFEFELSGSGRRLLTDGESGFGTDVGSVGRVVVGGDAEERSALMMGLVKDSAVRMSLPSSDVDSEKLFEVEVCFFTGKSPVVLMRGSGTLPRESVLVLLEEIERALKGAELDAPIYLNLGREVRGVVLTPLKRRIAEVEQSVRDALDDERFTNDDYDALQGYPARLAKIERLAKIIRDAEPQSRSFEPERTFPHISAAESVDFFFKWAQDVEEEARDSTARMSGLISSQQIVLTQKQASEAARFQRLVTIVGAAVLVPGLVAAVFGANVGFRGRDSTASFWAMLLLMAGSGLVSYTLIRATEIGLPASLAESRAVRWARALGPGVRLGVAAATGTCLALAGVIVLLTSA
jgi:hypothetical protein